MSKCIDEVQKALGFIGASNRQINRISDDELLFQRSISNGSTYSIYIWTNHSELVMFQSIAFKTVYGSPDKEVAFYQTILYFNSYLNYVNFGITTDEENGEWDIVISSNQPCNQINPKLISKIIQSFDYAFLEFVPQLRQQAKQWGLDFNGRVSKEFSNFHRGELEG